MTTQSAPITKRARRARKASFESSKQVPTLEIKDQILHDAIFFLKKTCRYLRSNDSKEGAEKQSIALTSLSLIFHRNLPQVNG